MKPNDINPAELAALLASLPVTHVLVTAARLGIEVGVARTGRINDDVIGGRYHRPNPLPEYSRLQVLRYPPTGNRDLWIRYGPEGPPDQAEAIAA